FATVSANSGHSRGWLSPKENPEHYRPGLRDNTQPRPVSRVEHMGGSSVPTITIPFKLKGLLARALGNTTARRYRFRRLKFDCFATFFCKEGFPLRNVQ
ncbi:MAG: hypothetical protein WA322_14165, partial [Pseudolabrys sp.]